ncbi:hypothetical protein [Luteolibacter marinus]|uniref:hypothetical protein n=1 Tax=Luteolibacter marinus TaxID=2776705 RepID=UPI001865BE12|nr:hypothetical protein [Luteolibacter marinus]
MTILLALRFVIETLVAIGFLVAGIAARRRPGGAAALFLILGGFIALSGIAAELARPLIRMMVGLGTYPPDTGVSNLLESARIIKAMGFAAACLGTMMLVRMTRAGLERIETLQQIGAKMGEPERD